MTVYIFSDAVCRTDDETPWLDEQAASSKGKKGAGC